MAKRATKIKIHVQTKRKVAKKVHFRKFESKKFQRQSRQNQEKRIDYETKGASLEGQMNAHSYDSRGVPSTVSHPLSP